MLYILYTIHVLTCLFLILVVLLQQGKGADLSVFGGGSTQAAFGARSAASLLHKLTVAFFILFIMTTLSIAFMQSSSRSTSVLSGVDQDSPPAIELQDEGLALPDDTPEAGLSPAAPLEDDPVALDPSGDSEQE